MTGAAKANEREALKKALMQVIDRSALKTARLSVQMQSLDDSSVVFAQNADELLNPASNVKLFTAAAALARLGTDYRFDTDFLTDADLRNDGKAKVLYVRGKGDPTMNTDKLYGIVSELLHAGLKEVVGDIVLDESWFDLEREAPGFDQESGDRSYLSPTGALSLNWNAVGVYLRPSDSVGAPAAVELEPASDYFIVEGRVTTGTRMQRRFTVLSRLDKDRVHQRIEVHGFVPKEQRGAWSVWKKIDQPALYFGATLKALLAQRGVKVRGRVKLGAVPTTARPLYVAQSETLDIVLKKLNKHSSNFVAEQLIKTLGAEVKGAPGTTAKGIAAAEEFLEKEVGLARGSYIMRNGSGLNDTNRFSAAQTNRLLRVMWERFPLAPEYLSALGIAGKDGTVKYRFEGSDAVGRLRAKTGTLENVSALSGYVQAVGGERFIFSIMVNDFPGRASTVVQHIDALGAAVAASGSASGPGTAVASLSAAPSVLGPLAELKARITTYGVVAQKADKRNVAFLRTSWRSEKDPAVRLVVADALYASDPQEGANVRLLIDSLSASDEVFGRLRKAAAELNIETPGLAAMAELSSSGNADAMTKLLEWARAASGEETARGLLADALAGVAKEAPKELIEALRAAGVPEREVSIEMLAEGMVRAALPDAPLWAALKDAQGALDAGLVEFARGLEVALSQRIAEAKAPSMTDGGQPLVPRPSSSSAVTPGG
ncbi:MAG: D-alanyl-D-alanine carboxypeptidase/D-alanyl-D-alanine-endopeptidase [Myxococcaceae bacterium]|nr:D-alanyl-D-alanine carboxypeptidase/D-alanyl-D-alanine-endopeptidase [Myxococcaceae bacterium]